MRVGVNMGWIKIGMTAVVFSAVLLAGCRYNIPAIIVAEVEPFPLETGEALPDKPSRVLLPSYDSSIALYKGLSKLESLIEFYKMRDNHPVWALKGERSGLGDSMVQFIRNIRFYGLLPRNYHLEELSDKDGSGKNKIDPLRRDVLLTDAFLSVAKDLKRGRLRQSTTTDDSLQRLLLDSVVQRGGLKQGLESQEPGFSPYLSLKRGLHALLDTIRPIDRALLLGGVSIDSIPLHQKIQAIEVNMERWRWERSGLGGRYIFINIPAFMASIFEADTLVFESRVIVGKPQNPTPQLSSNIQCFITYPYWHVPRKIAIEELLPIIKKDRGYIERNNFDVLDRRGALLNPDSLNWDKFHKNNFPVSLRQREGVDNSLGVLKFVFDNPFAVYLHDTNARRLFQNKARAFSHGCIRMEKAVEFAHYLVTGDIHERSPVVEKFLKEKKRHSVDLKNPIHIHVRYFTAEVKGGQLLLYNDLYEKDRVLIKMLYQGAAA